MVVAKFRGAFKLTEINLNVIFRLFFFLSFPHLFLSSFLLSFHLLLPSFLPTQIYSFCLCSWFIPPTLSLTFSLLNNFGLLKEGMGLEVPGSVLWARCPSLLKVLVGVFCSSQVVSDLDCSPDLP